MEGFTEKKWFVYLGDHHEGPYSLDEIQGKLSEGQVSSTQYVWCDGMTDWQLMSDVDAFATVRKSAAVPPATLGSGATLDRAEQKKIHLTAIQGGVEKQAAPTVEAAKPETTVSPTPAPVTPQKTAAPQLPTATSPATAKAKTKTVTAVTATAVATPDAKKKRMSRGFRIALVLVLLLVGGVYALFTQSDVLMRQPWLLKLPGIGSLISPIPMLDDVSSVDFEELRMAASAQEGTHAAVVLGQGDPFAPIFYAASNAPDGTELELKVEGVPDTLLNETSATFGGKQILQKKFARFEPLRGADGKTVPRGQYKVSLLNGAQILASKSMFLGGVKDAIYLARLKEFHDKLWEKATAELTELKQFAATQNEQLAITLKDFSEINRKFVRGNVGAKRGWEEASKKWQGLQAQLSGTFQKWTPESLKTDYIYGELRGRLQALGLQVEALHQLQGAFYESKEKAAEVELQITNGMQSTQASAAELTKALDELSAISIDHNKLPPRGTPTP